MTEPNPPSPAAATGATAPGWLRAYAGYVALSAVFALYAWSWKFSGDAMIHVSFMEQAANGHWFEFNPDVPDASSTSAMWTVLGAALWSFG
jgi:hypothetical protein